MGLDGHSSSARELFIFSADTCEPRTKISVVCSLCFLLAGNIYCGYGTGKEPQTARKLRRLKLAAISSSCTARCGKRDNDICTTICTECSFFIPERCVVRPNKCMNYLFIPSSKDVARLTLRRFQSRIFHGKSSDHVLRMYGRPHEHDDGSALAAVCSLASKQQQAQIEHVKRSLCFQSVARHQHHKIF